VDCITVGMQASAALVAGAGTTITLTPDLTPGSPIWTFHIGLSNGSAAGTTTTHSVCGLGLFIAGNTSTYTATLAFAAGFANVVESVSMTYYYVSNFGG
jgi:hypothetical protein